MTSTLESIIGNPTTFLDKVFECLARVNVDVSAFCCDHICYRVDNNTLYAQKKDEFVKLGAKLLNETIVGGRPIATYKLPEPIRYKA